nr:winged helix-turn-helix domain-containing protein [Sinorhizobium medicae]
MKEGAAVPLGSRALDILSFLASHPGELKTNNEIVKQVWPNTFVDEANLRVHLSALRKALGDTQRSPRFISNVPGRGYAFIAPLERDNQAASPRVAPLANSNSGRFPARIFGREESIAGIAGQLTKERLVTICGPGGIGKSTVAKAVLSRCAADLNAVWIDLSEVGNGVLIPTVVASELGILIRTDNILKEINAHLDGRNVVVALDSCEHVVEHAAEFAEALLDQTTSPRILTTSREPLRARGERVYRLQPLGLPPSAATAAAALISPAVQLFVDRADACLGGYELSDVDAPYVAEICSRLDGIALAIELAAGRLESLGIAALSRSLSDCFRVLSRGRRTALPRHQTLRATIDWSYLRLPPPEQQALKELSVLPGGFTGETARAVISSAEADDLLAALVSKSVLVADTHYGEPVYRLLDTTRLYASEKLADAGEFSVVMSSFSEHLTALLEAAEEEIYSVSMDEWSQDFAQQVPGLRAALDWGFGKSGDILRGVRLTVAALPLFFRLSLLDECLVAVTKALGHLDVRPDLDERSRMKLYPALGWPQMRSTDGSKHGIAAWTTALHIAEKLGDIDYQLRAIWALWVDAINRGEPRPALELVDRYLAAAPSAPDWADVIIGRRMHGATLHWLGRHAEAADELRMMLADYETVPDGRHSVRFQFDQRVTARIILARCLWVLGEEEAALREIAETLSQALDIRHHLSLSNVLAEAACPIALLSGRNELAAEYIQLLREHTKALSLDVWNAYADCFEAELQLRAGKPSECLTQIRSSMGVLVGAGFTLFQTIFQTTEAKALAASGCLDEALVVINSALGRCASSGERWCLPELHRVKGQIEAQTAGGGPSALAAFETALESAHRQGGGMETSHRGGHRPVSRRVGRCPRGDAPTANQSRRRSFRGFVRFG